MTSPGTNVQMGQMDKALGNRKQPSRGNTTPIDMKLLKLREILDKQLDSFVLYVLVEGCVEHSITQVKPTQFFKIFRDEPSSDCASAMNA